jgi:Ppx/GppA phosphatase family
MRRRLAIAVVVTIVAGSSILARRIDAPAPASCLIQPDRTKPVAPASGRTVYCGLDVGSKTVKLSVVSMVRGQNATIRDERQCKRTLGMGALVFDSTSRTARPLPDESIAYLSETVNDYRHQCALDGGAIVAAGATQWARDATNTADVLRQVKAETGVTIEVLSAAQEAEYSYVAAAAGTPGRIVLDPGSNSFELAWQARGTGVVRSIMVPYGYVRGAVNDIEPASDYAAGRAAYQAKAKLQIESELARLTPPMSLASLRSLVTSGAIGPDIIALGQDGAVQLSARGLLRRADRTWVADAVGYDAVLIKQPRGLDRSFGVLTAEPLSLDELAAFFGGITATDFNALATEPIRSLYGQKALVVPALVHMLLRELGAARLVMVPQEITTGHILVKLAR